MRRSKKKSRDNFVFQGEGYDAFYKINFNFPGVRTPASDTLQIRDCNEIIFIYQSNTLLFFVGITGTELTSLKFYFNTFMLVHNVCILLQITSNIISFKILINLCYRLNLFCYFSAYNYKKFARPKTPIMQRIFQDDIFFSPGFVCNQCK